MNDDVHQNNRFNDPSEERESPVPPKAGRFTLSPRATYLLIGGAALGLIVLMCLVVALIAAVQST